MDYQDALMEKFLADRTPLYGTTDAVEALQIRYIGSSLYCKITVDATGDFTSSTGDTDGSETADTNFKETGGTGGKIDVSDTNANTLAKVVDTIHALADYECVQRNGHRSMSSDGKFLAAAAADAKSTAGLTFYWDADEIKSLPLSITKLHTAFADYAVGSLPADPYTVDAGYRGVIHGAVATTVYTGGTSTFKVYDGTTLKYSQELAATTVEKVIGDNWGEGGGVEGGTDNVLTALFGGATTLVTAEVTLRCEQVKK